MTSTLGFKERVGSALFALGRGIHDIHALRFTSSATPLPMYNASIVASRFKTERIMVQKTLRVNKALRTEMIDWNIGMNFVTCVRSFNVLLLFVEKGYNLIYDSYTLIESARLPQAASFSLSVNWFLYLILNRRECIFN